MAVLVVLLYSGVLLAQEKAEPLDAVLGRGYVAHWLVCGPFGTDVDGGVGGALARNVSPLSATDFMEKLGGMVKLRPTHRMVVRAGVDGAMWQRAGASGSTLDLSPFFPKADEGIAFAAFYVEAQQPRSAFMELNTPLGARVWRNGRLLRDIRPAPLETSGVDKGILDFLPGVNVVVLEVPGASYEYLAKLTKMTVRELNVHAMANRTLLRGSSGFEVALRLRPVFPLGELFYVAGLENANTFSGMARDISQDTTLTLFNPSEKPSEAVRVTVSAQDLSTPVLTEVASIPPQSEKVVKIPIRVGTRAAGQTIPVTVKLVAGEAISGFKDASFDASVEVLPHEEGGKVYVVTGARYTPDSPLTQSSEMEWRVRSFEKHLRVTEQEPEYGFDLGPASLWRPLIQAYPEGRGILRAAIGMNRCAAEAGYGHPDERFVDGELLARNLVYGLAGAREVLGDMHSAYYAWEQPGLAPQTPQLLLKAGLPGVVSKLDVAGLPGLFLQEAPDGSVIPHRRKKPSPGPASTEELRHMAGLQRQELLALGMDTDMLVSESQVPPPEPFYIGAAKGLFQGYPSLRLEGSGACSFFDDLRERGFGTTQDLPRRTSAMNRAQPGSVATQIDLKQAHAAVEPRLLTAETLATFAALLGADYPEAALDKVWREVLYWSSPSRLGVTDLEQTYVDALAGYRDAATLSAEILDSSARYIAAQADTLSGKPASKGDVQSLVVFNPTPWARSDYCTASLSFENASGLVLRDDQGATVPFLADHVQRVKERFVQRARVHFVARNIPAWGYRTFYLELAGPLPVPSSRKDPQIENDLWTVYLDPASGAVRSIVDKKTGQDYAGGLINHVTALDEDPAQTLGGRELWTLGTWTDPMTPQEFRLEVSEDMQQITTVSSFGKGTLERTLRVYRGVARIDCETKVSGMPLSGHVLAATFEPGSEGCTPLYGERFGYLAGQRSLGILDFRTKGMDNLSGAGMQPALHWAAVAPSDYMQVGPGNAVPLAPATIVAGAHPALQKAARLIQRALIHRGIPARMVSDVSQPPTKLWSDSTEYSGVESTLHEGRALHIVIGSEEQNKYTGRILQSVDAKTAELYKERLQLGSVLYVEHSALPEEYGPAPALLFASMLPERCATLAEEFAHTVDSGGAYSLPPSSCLAGTPVKRAESGFAVLFPGSRLCSFEQDGTLAMLLAHEGGPFTEDGLATAPDSFVFHYALFPFAGEWRDGNVPKAAEQYQRPLFAIQEPTHLGILPGMHGFLSVSDPGVMVGSVRAAGDASARLRGRSAHPRDGIVLNLWEAAGRKLTTAAVECSPAIRQASSADFLGEPKGTLEVVEGRLPVSDLKRFSAESYWILPATPERLGPPQALGRSKDPEGPVYTRYWRHNTGEAPTGLPAVSVLLRGELPTESGTVQAVVANNLTDQTVEGTAVLECTDGWSVGPKEIYFNLQPGEYKAEDVSLVRTRNAVGGEKSGGLSIEAVYNGVTFRDTLEENPEPLMIEVGRTGAQVRVTIRNNSGIVSKGMAECITRPMLWPELGELAENSVTPNRTAVSVAAFGEQTVLFRFSDPDMAAWAVVKVGANGHVFYGRVPATGGAVSKP